MQYSSTYFDNTLLMHYITSRKRHDIKGNAPCTIDFTADLCYCLTLEELKIVWVAFHVASGQKSTVLLNDDLLPQANNADIQRFLDLVCDRITDGAKRIVLNKYEPIEIKNDDEHYINSVLFATALHITNNRTLETPIAPITLANELLAGLIVMNHAFARMYFYAVQQYIYNARFNADRQNSLLLKLKQLVDLIHWWERDNIPKIKSDSLHKFVGGSTTSTPHHIQNDFINKITLKMKTTCLNMDQPANMQSDIVIQCIQYIDAMDLNRRNSILYFLDIFNELNFIPGFSVV